MPNYALASKPMLCLNTVHTLTEFQTPEQRDAKVPLVVKVDEDGNPLVSVEFTRKVEEYGKEKSVVFAVTMPKNQVDPDLEMGFYSLIDPEVSVYADRKNPGVIRESWTASGMTLTSDSVVSK